MSISLSIVIPLKNEEESVQTLVSGIVEIGEQFNCDYEIILVDDGSTDKTWRIIERLKASNQSITGIRLRKNFGQTSAMVAGFEYARGEIIVTIDGDLQNDPSDIPKLLEKMAEGYDIVSGWRKNRKDNLSRVFPSRIANWLISAITKVHLHDYGCSLKAYRAECIRSIKAYGEMHRFFPALATMTGARIAEIEVNHLHRKYGKSKYGLDRIFKVFSDIFSIIVITKFSTMPLWGFTLCGLPFLSLGVTAVRVII